jgi:hypothetical protein
MAFGAPLGDKELACISSKTQFLSLVGRGWLLCLAVITESPEESLSQDHLYRRSNKEWLNAHVDESCDG